MIDRRTFSTMLRAGVATSLFGRSSKAQAPATAPSHHGPAEPLDARAGTGRYQNRTEKVTGTSPLSLVTFIRCTT